MSNLKKGDSVFLKSGGCTMSVSKVESNDVTCQWLDRAGHLQTGVFPAESLEKIKEDDQSDTAKYFGNRTFEPGADWEDM